MNKDYEFELSFSLPAEFRDDEEIANRLYQAGCDDALIGHGVYGQVALDVTREADSAFEAISSVIVQVSKGIPGAKLIEAGPDLVGVSDLAGLLGTTRQNLKRYLVDKKRSQDPMSKLIIPAHNGSVPLWHLAKIGRWVNRNTRFELEPATLETAESCMMLNAMRVNKELAGLDDSTIRSLIPIFMRHRPYSDRAHNEFHVHFQLTDTDRELSARTQKLSSGWNTQPTQYSATPPTLLRGLPNVDYSHLKRFMIAPLGQNDISSHGSGIRQYVELKSSTVECKLFEHEQPCPMESYLNVAEIQMAPTSENITSAVKIRLEPERLNSMLDN